MSYNRKELQVQSSAKKKQNPFLKDMIYDSRGQWAHPGQPTRIPSNQITMAGIPYSVLGIDNFGNQQMMYPGGEYSFPGDYVDEFPMAQVSKELSPETYNLQRALELGYTPDETGHMPSVDEETGMWLKSMDHPTAWKEYLYGSLNRELGSNYNVRVNPEGYFGKRQLQYVSKKNGGNIPKAQASVNVLRPSDYPREKRVYVDWDDPRILESMDRLNLYNWSQIPSRFYKTYFNPLQSAQETQELIDALNEDMDYTNWYEGYMNPVNPFNLSIEDLYNVYFPTGDPDYMSSTVGYMGSPITDEYFNTYKNTLNRARQIDSRYKVYDQMQQAIDKYTPNRYRVSTSYGSKPYTYQFSHSPNEKLRGKHRRGYVQPPSTSFVENEVSGENLRSIYPNLSDEYIADEIVDMQNNPFYFADVFNANNLYWPLSYGSWELENKFGEDYASRTPDTLIYGAEDGLDMYKKNYPWGRFLRRGDKFYKAENVIDNTYQETEVVPYWDKPEIMYFPKEENIKLDLLPVEPIKTNYPELEIQPMIEDSRFRIPSSRQIDQTFKEQLPSSETVWEKATLPDGSVMWKKREKPVTKEYDYPYQLDRKGQGMPYNIYTGTPEMRKYSGSISKAQMSSDVEYPEIHRKRFLGKGESYITKTPFGKHIEKWKYNPLTKTYVAKEIDIAYKDENNPRTVYRKKEIANKNNAYAIHKKRIGMNPWEKWIEKFQVSGNVEPLVVKAPEDTQYVYNPGSNKFFLQGMFLDKLKTLQKEYKKLRKDEGYDTYLNYEDATGDSSVENLQEKTNRLKSAIDATKINYKKGKAALKYLRKANPEKFKNTKVADLYKDPETLETLRGLYKTGELEESRYNEFYKTFGKHIDANVVKGQGANAAYDAERAEQIFNPGGISTAEVAKNFALGGLAVASLPLFAAAAPFIPQALANPLINYPLTGYGVYDATTRTLPEAYRQMSQGTREGYRKGAENLGWAALDLSPLAVGDAIKGVRKLKNFNKTSNVPGVKPGLDEIEELRRIAQSPEKTISKYDPTNWGSWKERPIEKFEVEATLRNNRDQLKDYFPDDDFPLTENLPLSQVDRTYMTDHEIGTLKNLIHNLKQHEPGTPMHDAISYAIKNYKKNIFEYKTSGKPLTGSDAFKNINVNSLMPLIGTAGLTGLGAYNQYQDEGQFPQEAGLGLLGSLALGLPMLRNMRKGKGINQEKVFKPRTWDERMETMDLNMGGNREVLFDPTTDEGKRLMDFYKRKGANIDNPTVKQINRASDDTIIKEERIGKFKEQQQKEFDLGKEFASNWILDVDAQKKFLKDHDKLAEKITQAKMNLNRTDWSYHHGKLTNEWFSKNPGVWDDPDGFKKFNEFLEESAERMNLTKEYKEYRKLEKELFDLEDLKKNLKSKSVDPEFKRKVKEIYLKTMQGDPKNIESFVENMHSGNLEVIYGDKNILVDPDIADEVFRSLPKDVQEHINKNLGTAGGYAFYGGDTVTFKTEGPGQFEGAYGRITLPEPTLKPKEVTKEKDFSLLKPKTWTKKGRTYTDIEFKPEIDYTKAVVEALLNKRHVHPLTVGEVAAHETAHPSQRLFGDWIDELQKNNPDYGYVTGHEKNELAKAYKEAMVEPTKVPEGSDLEHTYETWKSSVGELHSELMVARLKAAREYMNQGYSMEESIDILKQFEKEGNDELFQFYLDEASGNLDKHFKESTDYDTKKMLVQILPAGAAIFGFSMLNNDNSNLDKQKYGGSIKDYKIEYLTDQEIKDLESQGFKVVVED